MKSIWNENQRNRDDVLWIDKRKEDEGFVGDGQHPNVKVEPDKVDDFRNLELPDESFHLIVFDPPHKTSHDGMERLTGAIDKKYGALQAETWQSDLKKGFEELLIVLKPGGTLVFKWADNHISFQDVLKQIPKDPMFGTLTKKTGKTENRWFVFYKSTDVEMTNGDSR